MSTNNTSTSSPQPSDPPDSSTTSTPPSSTANPTTTALTSDPTTSDPPTSLTSDPPTSTTTTPTTSDPPTSVTPTSTSSTPPSTTQQQPTTSTPTSTSTPTPTPTNGRTSTFVTTVTSPSPTKTDVPTSVTTSSATSTGTAISPTGGGGGGLNNKGKIAVAVVVPIAAVALLVLAGIFLWRKRKQRKEAAEQARKEVEDYGYNPNADPTIPVVGAAGGPFEMKEDASAGYRGWGSTTLAGSSGRKASTTMSGGGPAGVAYSDATSPTRGNVSDTRSGEPLVNDGSQSPEGEILGAMGPSAAGNRADVHRGPSNASSSYSAAGRSDGSGEGGVGAAYGGGPGYYDQYGNSNPYTDGRPGAADPAAQPVIRDVTARRNTRIENSAHYPQQSAGISQNF